MKAILCILICATLATSAVAQEISFEKKSGEFKTVNGVIAKLTDVKVKTISGKDYSIMDASGQKELMGYLLHRFNDTFGGPSVYYYNARCTDLGLTAYRPYFTASLSNFKEIGEIVIGNNLLQTDGKIEEANMKKYFAELYAAYGNMEQRFAAMNDSMIKMASIPAMPVERNMRKPIEANEFGKIGQGNVAIGTWEYIESTEKEAFKTITHQFRIKNNEGGIICISWIELSGAHTYIFKNGARSSDNWTLPDFIHNNPIQNKQSYVVELSKRLIAAGLL